MRFERSHHAAGSHCGAHVAFLDFRGETTVISPLIAIHGTAIMASKHVCRGTRVVDQVPSPKTIVGYLEQCGDDGAKVEDIKRAVFPRESEITAKSLVIALQILSFQGIVKSEPSGTPGQSIWFKL